MDDAVVKQRSKRRARPSKLSDSGLALLLIVCGASVGGMLLATPRGVVPNEMPQVPLDRTKMADSLATDYDLAATLQDGEALARLEHLYFQHGLAEIEGEVEQAADDRAGALYQAFLAFRTEVGEDGVRALLARWTNEAEGTLDEGDRDDRDARLGSFPTMLDRYGIDARSADPVESFVRRTLYKARINASLSRSPTEQLEPIEVQAYWGWLAYAAEVDPPRRLVALSAYEEAGGPVDDSVTATLLYLDGDALAAAEKFERAYEEHGSLRLRNHGLAALATAE